MSLSLIDHLRSELDHIKQDGLYKAERVLTSPQQARIAVQSGAEVINFCANNYLGLANHGSVPLMRYVTVVAIWCRWPDTPWWHAKAQELVHRPDVVCYTCRHGGGALHPPLE
jgi:hypothetical protein